MIMLYFIYFYLHVSGPGRAVDTVCVDVCLLMTFERNDL